MRIFKTKRTFKREFKRQVKYAIAAAVGFLIAFAWRDAIYNAVHELIVKFTEETQTATSEISTAIFITIVGVFIILISSRLLRDKK